MFQDFTREDLIKHYFLSGYSYEEIRNTLESVHDIQLSIRQINRILRTLGLYRRRNHISPREALQAVSVELNSSASCFGYRLMHQKLRTEGVNIDRETVRIALQILDPEGVEQRSRRRFRRRKYTSKGPNHIWHLDGYDKLKPFGLAIHGAIDGYSRKILWLEVGSSNNNPRIVASYFVHTIRQLQLIPRCIRVDRGSENVVIGGIQRFLRQSQTHQEENDMSFRYGPSTRNQRIESWWSVFRRNRCTWWINFFKDLCDETIFDPSIHYHVNFLRFCFIGLVQTELDQTKQLWNNHRIRKNRNAESPAGRPNVLFFTPDLSGGEECKLQLNNIDANAATEMVDEPYLFGCSDETVQFALIIMQENDLSLPKDTVEAKYLLLLLIREIDDM